MGKPVTDPAELRSMPPRFSMGRIAGGSLMACLWLWTSAGVMTGASAPEQSAGTPYQRALERFNHEDYSRALALLEQVPAVKDVHQQADVFNLKGSIYLRLHRYAEARAAFDEATRLDPKFWAARFNAAEVSFREKRYAESHQQFNSLLGQARDSKERRFGEYKSLLAQLMAGKEKPARDFVTAHGGEDPPLLSWYCLSAALEYRHGRSGRGEAFLEEAGTNYPPSVVQLYADSFDTVGWSSHGDAEGVAASDTETSPSKGASTALTKEPSSRGQRGRPAAAKGSPTTLAVVSLLPDQKRASSAPLPVHDETAAESTHPAFRYSTDPWSGGAVTSEMPPVTAGMNASATGSSSPARSVSPSANVLARRRSHASPSPSASPEGSPSTGGSGAASSAAGDDSASATPTPSATPSGTPSSAFMQKFEAATVQFIQKDYVAAKKLLDEADAIQPHQPNSVSLRNQIFKQCYEAAYVAYQHADYPAALEQLDGADGVGSNTQNQSDAFNLRGLVLSKQRKYVDAENMFHKAVQTDPGLWAAKFNYAEVPFNYRNYSLARTRFEELFSQTDPAKQPVEAELTQFKVFLTLLLEGKEDAARTFMQHFNFSGATPARYFCQAALNFYSGDVEKAQGWIDSARKEYPARKSSSFVEAFNRVGWLNDSNAVAPGTAAAAAVAAASPSVPLTSTPAAAASPTPGKEPSTTLASSNPTPAKMPSVPPALAFPTPPPPSASPAIAAASPSASPLFRTEAPLPVLPSATPAIASNTPMPTATKAPALVVITPTPAASKAPAVAVNTPTPVPSQFPALVVSTPTPVPSKAPVLVVSTPTPTATKAPAVVVSSPTPTATKAPVVAQATPTPTAAKSPALIAAATPVIRPSATATPTPAATPVAKITPVVPTPTAAPVAKASTEKARPASAGGDFVKVLVVTLVALYFLYVVARIFLSAVNRKPKRSVGEKSSSYGTREEAEADKVETPR